MSHAPALTTPPEHLAAWLAELGYHHPLVQLAGGASPRTFWRLIGSDPPRLVMLTPDAGPTEHGAAATTSPTALWQAMRAYLASLALPVPDLVQASPDGALLLIDDLGDERLFDRVTRSPSERLSLYERAVDLLATFQRQTSATPPPFHVPIFSREHLLAELAEFADMALEHRHAITLSPAERAVLTAAGDTLAAHLIPELLAHRDFQSHNLMLRGDRLVLIDFQDAFWAPRVYDLVALLRDSYVRLPPDELDLLLARYAAHSGLSRDAVTDAFHLQTIQRKLKDSGRFVTLARRGKSQFLAFFADSIAYVITALTRSGRFPALLDLLLTHIPEARTALVPWRRRGEPRLPVASRRSPAASHGLDDRIGAAPQAPPALGGPSASAHRWMDQNDGAEALAPSPPSGP